MPPAPRMPTEERPPLPKPPADGRRRCSGCGTLLAFQGRPAIRIAPVPGGPESLLPVELLWCPGCGRLELFGAR